MFNVIFSGIQLIWSLYFLTGLALRHEVACGRIYCVHVLRNRQFSLYPGRSWYVILEMLSTKNRKYGMEGGGDFVIAQN